MKAKRSTNHNLTLPLGTRLILIRHGETDWNVEKRWQGQADVPLNSYGKEQAYRMAQALANDSIQAIYASDLQRARQTAEPLSRLTGIPVQLDVRLREINLGDWEGMTNSEIQARYPDLFTNWQKDPRLATPPGGETVAQVQRRVFQALSEILTRHAGSTVAVVMHGFAISLVRIHLEGLSFKQTRQLVPGSAQWLTYHG